ncbi:lipoyl(octanoyl) transferase LipB [Synechococcus sp. Nb3U1]|uniref:lipoyl(octanoyl) transferase LipB n=1 Tax=Synechococcus sp. Nb3U1 TaxID=1914529 RepID=UPI003FCC9985|nr:lipoyl(octanoyl) transferase LipB [Synechococcus sp. Nb3U1]
MQERPHLLLHQPGEVPYRTAWAWQQTRLARMIRDPQLPDGLLLLTHPAVYTLGAGADPKFLFASAGRSLHSLSPLIGSPSAPHEQPVTSGKAIEVLRVERGGEVTYHGPGQWVGYPLLNLRRHQPDLHEYLRQLEQVLIECLAYFGLTGERIPGLTGVWVEGSKLAAIGIKVSRWITYHGFALNVCSDLTAFEVIVPCGIPDRPVGSLAQFCPQVTMEAVAPVLVESFCDVFGLQAQAVSLSEWLGEVESVAASI